MEHFLGACVDLYCKLAKVDGKELRIAPTRFVEDDGDDFGLGAEQETGRYAKRGLSTSLLIRIACLPLLCVWIRLPHLPMRASLRWVGPLAPLAKLLVIPNG